MGMVRNLTLRQGGGGKYYAVDIGQGRLVLEDCDITSQSLSCVAVHGGADPQIRRNCIHDGNQNGILVYENGLGTIEDNDIFGNSRVGNRQGRMVANVEIRQGANPVVRRNRIHDGKGPGILVGKNGLGTIEDNDIFANAYSGVEVKEGGNPTVRHNRIHKNSQQAVYVHDEGAGTFEDNDLRDNVEGAWYIESGCEVKRARNQE